MDGLVLMDKAYLKELDDNLLRELDIFLDRYGTSELVYDFPEEKWTEVWKRETKDIVEFCNSGKMALFLYPDNGTDSSNFRDGPQSFIEVKSGELIVVEASELIQCLSYPDLKMETLVEISDLDPGIYLAKIEAINYNG